MSAVKDALAVVGALTVLAIVAFAVVCLVMWRRGREAQRYRDEMQGTA